MALSRRATGNEKLNQAVQLNNSSRTARIIDKPRVIEVPAKEKEGELW